jgi:ABC-type transporter Mla MlaB component
MLRITEKVGTDQNARLHLEGQVVGPWVSEVRTVCERFTGRELSLDLAGVSFIDREGIALFQDLQHSQVSLLNCSPFLVEQLKGGSGDGDRDGEFRS